MACPLRRWQARLDGISEARAPQAQPKGFVAARVAPAQGETQ